MPQGALAPGRAAASAAPRVTTLRPHGDPHLAASWSSWLPRAAASSAAGRAAAGRCQASKAPDSGYFSDVDPKAEVLPVKSGLAGDITQRSKSRWESDFIWNKDWAKQLDYEESLRKQQEAGQAGGAAPPTSASPAAAAGPAAAPAKGFLSLTSKVDLNSMDVDLSAQLRPRKKDGQAAAAAAAAAPKRRRPPVKYGSVPPTRVEQRAWERGGKYSRKVVAVAPANEEAQEELEARVAAERRRYEELKAELQGWAAGLTALGLGATLAFYGRDVAASYGVGALGGLLYLRLLNRSVDGVGGGAGGAVGQPRLLIPVILALGYNRYNSLVAEETGLTLQLLPMLVGFFTYKLAVVAKQSLVLFGELAAGSQGGGASGEGGSSSGASGEGGEDGDDVTSVDRAFRKRVLNEF